MEKGRGGGRSCQSHSRDEKNAVNTEIFAENRISQMELNFRLYEWDFMFYPGRAYNLNFTVNKGFRVY